MKSKIWLSSPHLSGNEETYVKDAFATNWIAPLGPHVNAFEEEISKVTTVQHTAALSSGTAALHLALILAGIKSGDEVICSTFTFSASANPIVYCNAVPVFVDSEPGSWNINPELLEHAILDRIAKGKKPKAAIIVHLYGMPASMNKIRNILNKYEIILIEDAAESLGSTYHGVHTGKGSFAAVLSFNGNKIITTSGGGALISEDNKLIEKARFLATQARDEAPHYQHSEIGYNYRMSNVCAAIGRGQLELLGERVKQRRSNFDYYLQKLSEFDFISFQDEAEGSFSNRWLTCITINRTSGNKITREDVRLALADDNIESRPLWKPMHLQPVFSGYPAYTDGTSEKLFQDGLCLPSGSNLSTADLDRVIDIIRTVLSS